MISRTVPLSQVCDITMGQAPKGDSYNDTGHGVPLIAGAGDFGDGVPNPKKFTTATNIRRSAPGDIIISIRASIGATVWSDATYCLGRGVAGLRASTDLDPQYLWHWTTHAAPALVNKGRGATFLQVNRGDLAEMEVPLPPIEEQREIAAVLDAAEALRTKRRQALAKLDTLTQAIFVDMFGHDEAKSWPMEPISSLAAPGKGTIRTGPFGSQLLHEEFTEDGIAVLGIDNAVQNSFAWGERRFISEEKYAELERFKVHPSDVLVTIMGTCGRVAIVPEDIPTAISTKHLCCITLDHEKCTPAWLSACLQFHPQVREQLGATHGAVMPGLNMGKIRSAEIPVPPLHTQLEFASHLHRVRLQRESVQKSSTAFDNLFASLQQRAFRGEL